MIKMLYPISSKTSNGLVTARYCADVNGRIRTVVDIYSEEEWNTLCSGEVLQIA